MPTLTTTHPDVSRLEQETKQQKQTIVIMEQQIQTLQMSVQDLVNYKTQEEAVKERFKYWQQGNTDQLVVIGDDAQETKQGQETIERKVINMQQTLQTITRLLQGGILSQP